MPADTQISEYVFTVYVLNFKCSSYFRFLLSLNNSFFKFVHLIFSK